MISTNIREKSMEEEVEPQGKFGLFSGYLFAINCTIGTGVLSIPFAFSQGGWLFGLLFELLVTIQGYYISLELLEAMSRAEILQRMIEEGKDTHTLSIKKIFVKPNTDESLTQSDLTPIITNRIIACPDIARLAFGDKFGRFFFVCLFLTKFGVMVSYGAIFATSFASNVPIGNLDTCDIYNTTTFYNDCRWKYWVYLLIFSVITVYLTIKGIEEQRFVQMVTFILRLLVMFLIILTCIVDISMHQNNENDKYNPIHSPPLFVPENFGIAMSIIGFASGYQVQIPSISKPVNNKIKNLPLINNFTILTCFVFYSIIGVLAAFAIHNVPSLVTLSYRNYSAGYAVSDRPFWTYMIEYIVVFTPAIDVFSGYPFQALTISDAIISWKYGESENASRKEVIIVRFIVAFSPMFVSFFVYNLGQILEWVGLFKFIIYQCFFPIMHIAMRHLVSGKSPYDVKIHYYFDWALIISNVFFFFFVAIMKA